MKRLLIACRLWILIFWLKSVAAKATAAAMLLTPLFYTRLTNRYLILEAHASSQYYYTWPWLLQLSHNSLCLSPFKFIISINCSLAHSNLSNWTGNRARSALCKPAIIMLTDHCKRWKCMAPWQKWLPGHWRLRWKWLPVNDSHTTIKTTDMYCYKTVTDAFPSTSKTS